MADSLNRHLPNADIDVWLMDDSYLPLLGDYANSLHISRAIDNSEFSQLALKYSILELSTAVKPYIFQYYLLAKNEESVVYLDPDLYFCRSIEPIINNGLKHHDYLLTPHASCPLPHDDKHPSDLDLLRSGTFNLGFIAVRNSEPTRDFINWWLDHLRENCWQNPDTGVFTDQKWINLAITYWPNFKSLTEPGLNVAYWNLHERKVDHHEGHYTINGEPLYFFHFSGFSPSTVKLSKHEDRIGTLKPSSKLYDLAIEYKNQLYKFGYNESIRRSVSVFKFLNGASLDPVILLSAQNYISAIKKIDKCFDSEEFYSWLTIRNGNFFDTKYIEFFLKLRPDVQNYFESAGKFDAEYITQWLQDGGANQNKLDSVTLTEIGIYKLPSVCYLGYVTAMSGVGDATRSNIGALKSKRYPIAVEDISSETIFDREHYEIFSDAHPIDSDITIAHVNADMLPEIYSIKRHLFSKYTIAYMAWETESFPKEWEDRDQYCDEVWVPSNFVKNAIEKIINIPVFVVPHALSLPAKYLPDASVADVPRTEGVFKFLVSFDACSDVARKNPNTAILAFREAFGDDDRVKLIVKISNSDRCGKNLEKILALIGKQKNIQTIFNNLSKEDYYRLLKSSDVYVSLHRGEGFGLNIQQAMAMGKPVIATNYGGNTDFCLQDNSIPIDYKIVPINPEESQYPYYTMWAEPDLQQASNAMRKLYTDAFYRADIGRKASLQILTHHSAGFIGSIMQKRLQRIATRLNAHVQRSSLNSDRYVDEQVQFSPENSIKRTFECLLGRTPSPIDVGFYRAIFDKYGAERVVRDILISNEGASRMQIPNSLKKLLGMFWLPSVSP